MQFARLHKFDRIRRVALIRDIDIDFKKGFRFSKEPCLKVNHHVGALKCGKIGYLGRSQLLLLEITFYILLQEVCVKKIDLKLNSLVTYLVFSSNLVIFKCARIS